MVKQADDQLCQDSRDATYRPEPNACGCRVSPFVMIVFFLLYSDVTSSTAMITLPEETGAIIARRQSECMGMTS
eukprot:3785738-Rhodomonas_salina.2